MWALPLACVASQAVSTESSTDFLLIQYGSPQEQRILLQYDRMMSSYLIVPRVREGTDYTTDDLHGLDDDDIYGARVNHDGPESINDTGSGHDTKSAPSQDDDQHSAHPDPNLSKHDEHHSPQPTEKAGHEQAKGDDEHGKSSAEPPHDVSNTNHGHGGDDHVITDSGHGNHDHHHKRHGNPLSRSHGVPEAPSATSTAVALMLVGMLAMGMSIFYFVNYPDPDIQQTTWTILSSTISLFCAVLIFSALKAVMAITLGEKVGPHAHHHTTNWYSVVFSFAHFILTYALNQLMLWWNKEKNFPLKAWATIGGHMTAFAAIESFGNLYHYKFASSWHSGCIVLVMAGMTVISLWVFSGNVHEKMTVAARSKEQQILFLEVCDEAGREYVSLTIGFLISMLIRHAITTELPPIHGSPRNKTQMQIGILFVWCIAFVLSLMIFAYAARRTMKETSGLASNVAHLVQSILSMSGGWCLLSWGQWLFWSSVGESMGESDKMQARMIMAIAFSAVVLSSIFIFDFIADHMATQSGVRALISTMALLLGLAWEAVFTLSIESISGHYAEHPTEYIYCELGMTFILCGIVLPAWVMYFLPKAEEGLFLVEEQQ
eukprot:gnl/MRDRNA2_/MRDRNA2_90105_c0_seq1.p1 gnl/MRDRNA2_/MRDRNA2_90105_c0~~gnl/MRDRNA2_/MRDRNA2_90105_c0_seq1.p1  ORF type:complete len:604 (+),score=68.02 gnl/MRDRNA2_/MRDRNA2_90105_c0_seq1:81-1892(+)